MRPRWLVWRLGAQGSLARPRKWLTTISSISTPPRRAAGFEGERLVAAAVKRISPIPQPIADTFRRPVQQGDQALSDTQHHSGLPTNCHAFVSGGGKSKSSAGSPQLSFSGMTILRILIKSCLSSANPFPLVTIERASGSVSENLLVGCVLNGLLHHLQGLRLPTQAGNLLLQWDRLRPRRHRPLRGRSGRRRRWRKDMLALTCSPVTFSDFV